MGALPGIVIVRTQFQPACRPLRDKHALQMQRIHPCLVWCLARSFAGGGGAAVIKRHMCVCVCMCVCARVSLGQMGGFGERWLSSPFPNRDDSSRGVALSVWRSSRFPSSL